MNLYLITSILFVFFSSVSAMFYLRFVTHFFPSKVEHRTIYVVTGILTAIGSVLYVIVGNILLAGIIQFVMCFCIVWFAIRSNPHKAVYSFLFAIIFCYAILVTVGSCYATFSAFEQKNMATLLVEKPFYLALAACISSISTAIAFSIIPSWKRFSDGLFDIVNHFDLVCKWGYLILFVIVSIMVGTWYFMSAIYTKGILVVYSILLVSTFVCTILVLVYMIQVAQQMDYEVQNKQYRQQLDLQMMHYRSYADYTRGIRRFQDKYKQMMASIQDHLLSGEYDQIKPEIDEINELMYRDIVVHKEYSNHPLVDAILQSISNECKLDQVPFNAKVYAPKGITLGDGDLCQVITSLASHLLKVQENCSHELDKYLTFESSLKSNWIMITGSVSCNSDPITTEYQDAYERLLKEADCVYESQYVEAKHQYRVVIGLRKPN